MRNLALTDRKTRETFIYKYIVEIKGKNFDILSNFDTKVFCMVLDAICEKNNVDKYTIVDRFEIFYTEENLGVTLDVLENSF